MREEVKRESKVLLKALRQLSATSQIHKRRAACLQPVVFAHNLNALRSRREGGDQSGLPSPAERHKVSLHLLKGTFFSFTGDGPESPASGLCRTEGVKPKK